MQALLLDIEGTTTPIAFVVERLFGYARTHSRSHIARHIGRAEYVALFDGLRDEHASDQRAGHDVPMWVDAPVEARVGSLAGYVEWLMDRDRKSTSLKELQGRIWEDGYRSGELVGEVFADVPAALARWHAQGVGIGIFSSGSVQAQQLLFRHSSAGDLTKFLRWYFDTTTGAKRDAASYRRIAEIIGVAPARVLFISDVTGELDAARTAGMQTRFSIRPGNAVEPRSGSHAAIETFADVVVPGPIVQE